MNINYQGVIGIAFMIFIKSNNQVNKATSNREQGHMLLNP
jgi:hypothetical protein